MRELWNGSAGGLAAGSFRRARPRPVLGASNKPGAYRIRLDIRNHGSELLISPNPTVEILALPERLSGPACQSIGAHGGCGFQPSQNLGKLCMRLHDDVNMIGHDNPREQVVTVPNAFAIDERLHKRVGNILVSQPSRAFARTIQLPIVQQESSPHVGIRDENCWLGLRKGACQAPGDEDNSVLRDPMWKSSVPEHSFHGTGGKTAGAPGLRRYRTSQGRTDRRYRRRRYRTSQGRTDRRYRRRRCRTSQGRTDPRYRQRRYRTSQGRTDRRYRQRRYRTSLDRPDRRYRHGVLASAKFS
jgi:hypothetical protein